jgi:hypothetical protein
LEGSRLALPKHAATGESSPEGLDPAPVDAQVGVTQTRGRSDRDDLLGGSKLKLEVIDEAEERAAALCVKVVRSFLHDAAARQLRDGLPDGSPGLGGSDSELKRRHMVAAATRVTRDTVR